MRLRALCYIAVIAFSLLGWQPGAVAEEKQAKGEAPREPVYTEGVFFGTIKAISEESSAVEVHAIQERLGNRVFHVDAKTRFYIDSRRERLKDLLPGHRVAVHYIAKNRFALAKTFYVEFGEFKRPEEYKRTPRRARRRSH